MTVEQKHGRVSDWFRQWRVPLRRFLLGRTGVSASDVDDVAQEVFLRLMRYEKSGLVEHPQAYLFKMASNVAAEWSIRARQRHPHDSKWLDALVGDDRPENEVLRIESQQEIERVLLTLTPRQREIMKLFFYEGLNHKEISIRTEQTERSVRRHFVKSYQKLRLELAADSMPAGRHGRE
jgi:RNA polymerase sigma-70 factor (ECF subfamily)